MTGEAFPCRLAKTHLRGSSTGTTGPTYVAEPPERQETSRGGARHESVRGATVHKGVEEYSRCK